MKRFPSGVASSILDHGAGLSVLVVRLGALGDILRTLPAVRLIRFSLPEARIDWVCDDRWSAVLEGNPDLNGLIRFDRSGIARAARRPWLWPALPGAVARARRALRESGADLVLDFHGNLRSGVIGRMTGAVVRLGYSGPQQREGNRLFSTHRVEPRPVRTSRMERNLDLVRALGLPDGPLPDAGLTFSPRHTEASREIVRKLAGPSPYGILAPTASRRQIYKKPPTPLLVEASRVLSERGIAPIVVFGPGEERDAETLVSASAGTALPAPPTDLGTLSVLLRTARIFVGGDTGPLHLACAVGTPVVGIYGPTDPLVNTPWGVPHEAVYPAGRTYTGIKRIDRESGGFEGIAPGRVGEAVLKVLAAAEADL